MPGNWQADSPPVIEVLFPSTRGEWFMRGVTGILLILSIGSALTIAVPSQAVVKVAIGDSWDGPNRNLQTVVDDLYGAGRIRVTTDYIGAKVGDLDPWYWHDNRFSALLVTVVSGNGASGQLGWYEERGKIPVLRDNGIHDGSLFDGQAMVGATAVVRFRKPVSRFGFYLIPNHPGDAIANRGPDKDDHGSDKGDHDSDKDDCDSDKNDCDSGKHDCGSDLSDRSERFYTNRSFNDVGPDGAGALHPPSNGDVQALVFDLSGLKGQGTWLVCFEDSDAGATPGPLGQAQTDNDYSDLVIEVTVLARTDAEPLSFGGLKAKYTR
jgi:hypothetical protein